MSTKTRKARTQKTSKATKASKATTKKEAPDRDEIELAIRQSYPKTNIVVGSLLLPGDKGNPTSKRSVEIVCPDCPKNSKTRIRRVFSSDLFQVHRCVACTKALRKELAKAARAEARAEAGK